MALPFRMRPQARDQLRCHGESSLGGGANFSPGKPDVFIRFSRRWKQFQRRTWRTNRTLDQVDLAGTYPAPTGCRRTSSGASAVVPSLTADRYVSSQSQKMIDKLFKAGMTERQSRRLMVVTTTELRRRRRRMKDLPANLLNRHFAPPTPPPD